MWRFIWLLCCGVTHFQTKNGQLRDTKTARCQMPLKLSWHLSRPIRNADDDDADDDGADGYVNGWLTSGIFTKQSLHTQTLPANILRLKRQGVLITLLSFSPMIAIRLFVYIYFLVWSSSKYVCLTSVKEVMLFLYVFVSRVIDCCKILKWKLGLVYKPGTCQVAVCLHAESVPSRSVIYWSLLYPEVYINYPLYVTLS